MSLEEEHASLTLVDAARIWKQTAADVLKSVLSAQLFLPAAMIPPPTLTAGTLGAPGQARLPLFPDNLNVHRVETVLK
jgi:hypothetical protein